MSIGPGQLIELLAGLTSPSSERRSRSADEVTDWLSTFSDVEALIVSYVLMCLVIDEKDVVSQEAELHALAEMAEYDLVPSFVLHGIHTLDSDSLVGSSLEHYNYLMTR